MSKVTNAQIDGKTEITGIDRTTLRHQEFHHQQREEYSKTQDNLHDKDEDVIVVSATTGEKEHDTDAAVPFMNIISEERLSSEPTHHQVVVNNSKQSTDELTTPTTTFLRSSTTSTREEVTGQRTEAIAAVDSHNEKKFRIIEPIPLPEKKIGSPISRIRKRALSIGGLAPNNNIEQKQQVKYPESILLEQNSSRNESEVEADRNNNDLSGDQNWTVDWSDFVGSTQSSFREHVAQPTRTAVHNFFYPSGQHQHHRATNFDSESSISSQSVDPNSSEQLNLSSSSIRLKNLRSSSSASVESMVIHNENNDGNNSKKNHSSLPTSISNFENHNNSINNSTSNKGNSEEQQKQESIKNFWRKYDEFLILSLFSQIGIMSRVLSSTFFAFTEGTTFTESTALFTTLPLNCLSCFILGLLCNGENAMKMVRNLGKGGDENRRVQLRALERRIRASRSLVLFPAQKEEVDVVECYYNNTSSSQNKVHAVFRPRNKTTPLNAVIFESEDETGIELNIQHNHSLPSIPAQRWRRKRQRHYGHERLACKDSSRTSLSFSEENDEIDGETIQQMNRSSSSINSPISAMNDNLPSADAAAGCSSSREDIRSKTNSKTHKRRGSVKQNQPQQQKEDILKSDLEKGHAGPKPVLSRSNSGNLSLQPPIINTIADGWDVGTTFETMSDGVLLGLRVGLCGGLSTFSSWNSSMVNLLKSAKISEAFVGYLLGLQLPIISYCTGQYLAVYIFVWRCRREVKIDERRGYGLRVSSKDADSSLPYADHVKENEDNDNIMSSEDGNYSVAADTISTSSASNDNNSTSSRVDKHVSERVLSVRAIFTSIFILALICQITTLVAFTSEERKQQQFAISLLFSPLGCLARWKLMKYNNYRPSIPLGTFACNLLGCALSGSLGSLLAGNPGPEESIVLSSMISGFAGSLSTLSQFVVEMLDRIDPIMMRIDGLIYAFATVFWAMVIGLLFAQGKDWAEDVVHDLQNSGHNH